MKELLFMNDMGEGALVVQYLIAETGLQAQENEGYLRLIKLRTFTATAFFKEKRGRPERGGEGKVKHFSLMWRNLEYVGRQRERRGRERESQRQRWRLCRRTIDSTRSQIAEDHFYSPL